MYYYWAAAVASTSAYYITGEAPNSICPKGWRLPTGGTSGEFQTLYNNYNDSSKMQDTDGPAFVLSGLRSGSNTSSQGSYGSYWSSTAGGSNYTSSLYVDRLTVGLLDHYKYGGRSVRCVAQ